MEKSGVFKNTLYEAHVMSQVTHLGNDIYIGPIPKKDDVLYLRNKLDISCIVDLTPIQLVCVSWLKRIRTIKGDSNLVLNDYFLKRRTESKTFENNIRLMYDYYKEKINKNIHRIGPYDICVNIN